MPHTRITMEKHKPGDTDLLKQYEYCINCKYRSISNHHGLDPDRMWCRLYDEFLDIDRLKNCSVFCTRNR